MKRGNCCDTVHSLLSLDEAKVLLGTDDREDSLLEFLLVSSTYAIEEYCMRRLLRKRVKECFVDTADVVFPLKEYPVADISVVERVNAYGSAEPLLFDLSPEAGALVNVPYILRLVYARGLGGRQTVQVKYTAGYSAQDVTPDLKEACFELTAWKYARHNERLAGIVSNNKAGGLAFENKMPERAKELLEPYRRKTL